MVNAIESNDEDNKGKKGKGAKKTRRTLGRSGGSRKSAALRQAEAQYEVSPYAHRDLAARRRSIDWLASQS